jgi:orotidine-5'-phosphate decarboxylase
MARPEEHSRKNYELEEVAPRSFRASLERRWQLGNFVCVGLDSQYDKIPEVVREKKSVERAVFEFNQAVVDATHDLVCAYKPQYAFYGALGEAGVSALRRTIDYIHDKYPDIPVILDAKRNDIGNTSEQYAKEVFDIYGVDAVTVNPYLGKEALQPFLDRKDKGVIVLCRTSNPGAGEFQDLVVKHPILGEVPFYQVVAYQIANEWNANGNCALVVGATYPEEAVEIRKIAPDLPFLIPGIGKQGGDVKKAVETSKTMDGRGMIINSSRGIIFASPGPDFAEVARTETEKLKELINQYR